MNRTELLVSIARLQAELDAIPNRPEEPAYVEGNPAVIRFQITCGYRENRRPYWFVAIRSEVTWFISGGDTPQSLSWLRLWDWIEGEGGITPGTKVECVYPDGWGELA